MTIGEGMFRLAVALSGLGYYGCLFAGMVLVLAWQRVWQAVADGWAVRQEWRQKQALASRPVVQDDTTVVVHPPAACDEWDVQAERDLEALGLTRVDVVPFDRGVVRVGE